MVKLREGDDYPLSLRPVLSSGGPSCTYMRSFRTSSPRSLGSTGCLPRVIGVMGGCNFPPVHSRCLLISEHDLSGLHLCCPCRTEVTGPVTQTHKKPHRLLHPKKVVFYFPYNPSGQFNFSVSFINVFFYFRSKGSPSGHVHLSLGFVGFPGL